MKRKDHLYALGAFSLLTAILIYKVPMWFMSLGHVTLGSTEDGIKTYFTYLWHLKFDVTYTWFTGMNYPFGEQIMFTDNQPILVSIAKLLKLSASSAIALLNGVILLSVLATAPVLFFLLRTFRLPRFYSLIAAVSISLFSPQLNRISGHEGLSHPFVVPLLWLMLITFLKNPRARTTVGIAAFVTFVAGIHPYYLLISTSFIVSFWIASLWTKQLRFNWHTVAQCCLPLVAFMTWSKATDPIHDRITPLTSLGYRAYFESVFLPYESSPLRPYADVISKLHTGLPVECLSYVGFAGFILLITLLVRISVRFKRTKRFLWSFRFTERLDLRISLIASVIVLLYSLGYPWTFLGENAFRKMGPLAQFRSLGRFAWVFFYAFSVYIFYAVYWFSKLTRKNWLIPAFLALYIFEAASFSIPILTLIDRNTRAPNSLTPNPELAELLKSIEPDRFQSLIPIPFFQHGAETAIPEEIRARELPKTLRDSIAVSYATGLPMMAQSLSRSSRAQSQQMFSIFSRQRIRPAMPNDKPLLILVGSEPKLEIEMDVVRRAKLISSSENYTLLELSADDL